MADQILDNGLGFARESVGGLMKVISDFNVIGFALGLIIGQNVSELAKTFINGVIMPTLKPVLQRLTGSEKEFTIQVGSIRIELGEFINALIKFLALSIVIFIMLQFGVSMKKPVQWVKIVGINEGLKI
jgi:large-conductance mechanosensitive channel